MIDEFGEYYTRLINMPTSIKGYCYHDDDGTCYIVLNANLTNESNRDSYIHEVGHISRDELSNKNYREYE